MAALPEFEELFGEMLPLDERVEAVGELPPVEVDEDVEVSPVVPGTWERS